MRFLEDPPSSDEFFKVVAAEDHQGVSVQSAAQANDDGWAVRLRERQIAAA